MKCYWKAHAVGDMEGGIALFQLARLYERTNDTEQAAAAFHQYIQDTESLGITERDQQSRAYRSLAQYHMKKGQYEDAYQYAQKCTEFQDTREEGKALLKEIASRRGSVHYKEDPADKPILKQPKEDQLDPDASGVGGPEGYVGSPAVANASHRDLEPMNLTFTP